jgi:hypothetical protein
MAFYVSPSWACTLFRNNKQHVVLGQKRNCQRVQESGLWRIQRERWIEVKYLPNGTNAGKYLQIQREFGRVALPWVRSNGPTDPLHISCICSIWKILHFYSSFSLNLSKSAFLHSLTLSILPKNHMLFIVSKQCAYSRRDLYKMKINTELCCKRYLFWQKRPKTIVIRIIFLDDNIQIYSYGLLCELVLSMRTV